ncbi:hypothetical protein NA57DRAFT_58970 [Rhizodiscina lignyota]|uniref:Uncharacterized protein n=1 Tax=Rhizodiscina lignyota TaxID=1504668 RepID=A0A9P4I6I4_9PEZI|nr:hypothetical protein NA57DRAFT_58970 [Rhizodiscina lignyota]
MPSRSSSFAGLPPAHKPLDPHQLAFLLSNLPSSYIAADGNGTWTGEDRLSPHDVSRPQPTFQPSGSHGYDVESNIGPVTFHSFHNFFHRIPNPTLGSSDHWIRRRKVRKFLYYGSILSLLIAVIVISVVLSKFGI